MSATIIPFKPRVFAVAAGCLSDESFSLIVRAIQAECRRRGLPVLATDDETDGTPPAA